MSSIIIDLEEEALRSNVDIIALLRKSKVISHKLQLQEFEEWTNNELMEERKFQITDIFMVN